MELNKRCWLSNSTQDTEFRLPPTLCSGGKATAHLKAIAHVPPNKLYIAQKAVRKLEQN
jgi:hypothetical protein